MNTAAARPTGWFTVQTTIRRPLEAVFQAIVEPQLLTRYFAERADGPLVAGQTVVWHWADWGDYPVRVTRVDRPRRLEFEWNSTAWKKTTGAGFTVQVTIELEALPAGDTLVKISESGWPETTAGVRGSHENCSGWTHMGLCLKAFLEHDLDLR